MPAGAQSERLSFDGERQSGSAALSNQQLNGYPSSSNSPSVTKRNGQLMDKARSMQPSRSFGKSARDLSNLIDLMPPLSIEQDTKRLILAKKLDRENLDRYITAGGYQSSSISGSQSGSSASLTVHIKCQLKEPKLAAQPDVAALNSSRGLNATSGNSTNASLISNDTTRKISKTSSYSNSILIPIHLIVTDENDNWPMFINSPYIIDLNETAQVGALLPGNEIVAIDNDQQGPLSTIEYSIVAGSLWSDSLAFLNPLDARSLIIKDNSLLDYEAQSKLSLKVMARDQGEPPNWAITSLYINLFDNDDLNPVFSEDKYFGYVKDNQPGEVIDLLPKRLTARDGDKTINAPIVYSFHTKTNHSIHFDLDPDLGKLSLKKSLLEETNRQHFGFCLLVRASQLDNPHRWSLSMINMRMSPSSNHLEQLLTINEPQQGSSIESSSAASLSSQQQSHQFKFPHSNYTVEVSESAPPGFTVLSLKASFGPQNPNNPGSESVTYHLLDNEAGYFQLDSRSARLTLNRSLDYELYRHLSIRILATYEYQEEPLRKNVQPPSHPPAANHVNNYPKLLCDITRVNINILNQNDHKPEFSHEQYNFQLSVSDLIANFELPQSSQTTAEVPAKQLWDTDQSRQQVRAGRMLNEAAKSSLMKRFGEFELEEPPNEDLLDWRAMQLGQMYCADRDHGDKVTLKLTGSKVNLFHLTQDGRLYLPLVNLTHYHQPMGALASGNGRPDHQMSFASRTINNQFLPSKLFSSSRRSDHQDVLPDRNYLNYLLSEVSNLGRLRLKVTASDNGLPEAQQTTAVIVITIISIDNFILQRAPQLPRGLNDFTANGNAVQLSNNTSYDTSSRIEQPAEPTDKFQQQQQQVMMIPATNGRSFVQINPDIITNLISHQNNQQPVPASDGNSSATGARMANDSSAAGRFAGFQSPATLSNLPLGGSATSGGPETASIQSGSRFKPPSLLLVDDDGAKFVAMPVAMEVYEKQVQEAADLQQARMKGHAGGDQIKRMADTGGRSADGHSFWSSLWRFKSRDQTSQDGAQSATSGGFLHWINLSTAIMLHLLAVGLIITLVSKFRSSVSGQIATSRSLVGGLWPSRFRRSPPFMQSPKSRAERSATSILDQATMNGGDPFGTRGACLSSSDSSEGSSGYSFLSARQQHRTTRPLPDAALQTQYVSSSDSGHCSSSTDSVNSGTNPGSPGQRQASKRAVSSGVVVSAMSNGYQLRASPLSSPSANKVNGGQLRSNEAFEIAKHTNLFGHLKMTLNKMLDSNDESKQAHIGQVTIKALDSDQIPFAEHHNRGPTTSSAELTSGRLLDAKPASSAISIPETIVEVRSGAESASLRQLVERKQTPSDLGSYTKSSTFVGGQRALSPNHLPRLQQGSEKQPAEETTTVVSINVAPAKVEPGSNRHSASTRRSVGVENSSSSSSVVSLVSMSSSIISNKIKAAVERTGGETVTGSDVSSLDSTNLFNEPPQASGRSRRTADHKHPANGPPPPPPPPPPPSMVHVRVESPPSSMVSTRLQLDGKPFSARPVDSLIQSSTGARKPLPQNPLHVKLKQQAAAISAESSTLNDSSSKKRDYSGKSGGSFKRTSDTNSPPASTRNSKGKKTAFPKVPPTPPPLPSNLMPGNMKTVSPTTSVDRGYESLQSYTSSSHLQHQHLQQQRPQTAASGYSSSTQQTSSDLMHGSAGSPSARQPMGASSSSTNARTFAANNPLQQQSPVAGRQSQRPVLSAATQVPRSSPRQVYKSMIEEAGELDRNPVQVGSLAQRGKQRAGVDRSVAISPGTIVAAGGRRTRENPMGIRATSGTSKGPEIMGSANQHQPKLPNPGRAERSAQSRARAQEQAQLARQSALTEATCKHQQSVDCETEDDDFYYCYSHPPLTSQSSRRADASNVLSDYASHTYNDRASSNTGRGRQKELLPAQDYHPAKLPPRNGFIVDQSGVIELGRAMAASGSSSEMQLLLKNGTDLRLNPTQAAMMYHLADAVDGAGEQQLTSHHQQPDYSQHQQPQQRHLRNSFNANQASASNKKVLTWSDQVGLT